MQDRTDDLRTMEDVDVAQTYDENEMLEIPIDNIEPPAGLEEFNQHYEQIKHNVDLLRLQIQKIRIGHTNALTETSESQSITALNSQLESEIEELVKDIGRELKVMNQGIKKSNEHTKWKQNVHSLITRQFMDLLISYRASQSQYRDKVKERIRERVLTVKPDATPTEVESIVNNGTDVFSKQLADQNILEAKDALNYVERRHEELLKIEESVEELYRMFTDMALLVEQSGEYVDNIEANVGSSVIYVKEGNKALVSAMKSRSRRRWCLCTCCIVTLIILAVAIVILIVLGQGSNWWGK